MAFVRAASIFARRLCLHIFIRPVVRVLVYVLFFLQGLFFMFPVTLDHFRPLASMLTSLVNAVLQNSLALCLQERSCGRFSLLRLTYVSVFLRSATSSTLTAEFQLLCFFLSPL